MVHFLHEMYGIQYLMNDSSFKQSRINTKNQRNFDANSMKFSLQSI